MTEKFTKTEREYFKQLVIECDLQRFNEKEATAYIKTKMGKPVSKEYYYHTKKKIKENTGAKLAELQKNKYAFLSRFFEREEAIKKREQELWKIYYSNSNKPHLQKECMSELREETKFLLELDLLLAAIASLPMYNNDMNVINLKDMQRDAKKQARVLLDSKQEGESNVNEYTDTTNSKEDNTGSSLAF